MRTMNAAALALMARIQAGEQIPMVQLVQIGTAPVLYRTTAGCDVVWSGQTYAAASIQIDPVEDARGELRGLNITLPAVTSDQLSLALTVQIEGVSLLVYDALVDPLTGVVADAVLAWSGSLNVPAIEDGETASVVISAEHRGVRALRVKPSRYTDDEQRRLYTGDSSLNSDPATDAAPLAWPAASYFRQ